MKIKATIPDSERVWYSEVNDPSEWKASRTLYPRWFWLPLIKFAVKLGLLRWEVYEDDPKAPTRIPRRTL